MIFSYLKLSVRLLLRNPFFTIINTLGLSAGFTAFIILWPYAQSELNSDRFHANADRIGRLSRHVEGKKNPTTSYAIDIPIQHCGVARKIANEFTDIEDLTRIVLQPSFELNKTGCDTDVFFTVLSEANGKKIFREQRTAFADPNFFQFFSFPLLSGDPAHVLELPNSVVLSEKLAQKYFPDSSPLDKIIYLKGSIALKVTGVFQDLPKNTHMVFDMLISTTSIKKFNSTAPEDGTLGHCYIKIKEGADFNTLHHALNKNRKRLYGICEDCHEEAITAFTVQSLDDILFTPLPSNAFISRSKDFLAILSTLSFIILALAWINYVSLSVNMLNKRLAEFGTRKVVGATSSDFSFQFLTEAAILNALSFLVALTFVQLLKGQAIGSFGFYIIAWESMSTETVGIIIFTAASGILLTGLYPSIISRGKKPIHLLKKLKLNTESQWIHFTVMIQYATALSLLIWIGTIYFQLDLILSKSIGIEKDGILVIDCPLDQGSEFKAKLREFMNRARQIDGVEILALSKSVPGDYVGYGIALTHRREDEPFGFFSNGGVDENFIPLYGITLLAGRNFQSNHPADKSAILISAQASAAFGFASPDAAIGEKLILPWHNQIAEVIGVYKDYQFRPFFMNLRQGRKISDSFITYKDYLIQEFYPSKISVKTDTDDASSVVSQLRTLFKNVFPEDMFQYYLLNDNVSRHYKPEKVYRNQIVLFTLIAVGIACLGLLGTVANKAVEKTKEIGIRKVLGATLYHISGMLLKVSIRQIVIASIISLPVAHYLTEEYLRKFSDRISLQWWHYILPVFMLFIFMIATICSVLWTTAKSNPVDALKYD